MWSLGMQVFCGLFKKVLLCKYFTVTYVRFTRFVFQFDWIGEFVTDSGWMEEVMTNLGQTKKGGLEDMEKAAYQDLLCHIVS